jgi:signal transduction histidine kinase
MDNNQLYLNAISITIIISTVVVCLFAFFILNAIKHYNKRSLVIKKEYDEYKGNQEKLLLETEIEIQEQTFQLISKEIHDNITQSLSLANLTLNCLDLGDKLHSHQEIQKSKVQITKALNDLNNLSKSLDSDLIESHGLVAAVNFETERWRRLFDNKINVSIDGEIRHLNKNCELFIFRIIQESINNSVKYAEAANIDIALAYRDREIELLISDDGKGFNINELESNKEIGKKSGIKNMRQRTEILNGAFEITSKQNSGTSIKTIIPIQ